MKPVLINRSQIDPVRWDTVVKNAVCPGFYGFCWYLDVVSESWQALVWPSPYDYQIIMPLPIKGRLGIPVVYQPHFCQFLGLFSAMEITEKIAAIFLKSCVSYFPYISSYSFHSGLSVTIGSLVHSFPDISFVENHTFRKSMKSNQPYNADRNRNLKKGIEWNWVIQDCDKMDGLITLFSTHHAPKIDGGVSSQSYHILKKLITAFRSHGSVTLQYASLSGKAHAGILIFRYRRDSVYIFNAADEEGRKGNARTVMLNNYFQDNKGTDLLFDFESAQELDIQAFYRSFGAVDTPFFSISRIRLDFPLNYFQSIRRLMIRTRRVLLSNLCKI